MTSDFFSFLSIVVASGALGVSLSNHRRQKTADNENHVFKQKIEVYNKLISRVSELIKFYEDALVKMEDHQSGLEVLKKDDLLALADKVDEEGHMLAVFFADSQLLLSNNVIQKLDNFIDDFLYFESGLTIDEGKLKDAIDNMYDHADNLVNELRDDLKIERLNKTLFNRLS